MLRRYRLYTELAGYRLPSLPARVVRDLGARLPEHSEFRMRWSKEGHRRFSYSELYRLLTEQRHALGADDVHALDKLFRNKIIVVGSSAAGSFDHHLTPLEAGYPGVDILAVAIDNLMNGSHLRSVPAIGPVLLGALLIASIASVFSHRFHPVLTGATLALLSLGVVFLSDLALAQGLLLRLNSTRHSVSWPTAVLRSHLRNAASCPR